MAIKLLRRELGHAAGHPVPKQNMPAKGINGYLFFEPCKTFARAEELSL
jgi:hypothetical protein